MTVPFVATPSWLPDASSETAAPPRHPQGPDGARPAAAAPLGELRAPGPPGAAHPRAPHRAPPPLPRELELELLAELAPFASAPDVTDLFVNSERGLWIDRGEGAVHEPAWAADEVEVRALAIRLVARGGRHLDEASPAVDVRLGSGIRVHAVLRELHSPAGASMQRLARSGAVPGSARGNPANGAQGNGDPPR